MNTINETLEKLMALDFESREMIIEITQKRQVEERRKEIAHNAKKATTAHKNNKTKAVTSSEIISLLNSLL